MDDDPSEDSPTGKTVFMVMAVAMLIGVIAAMCGGGDAPAVESEPPPAPGWWSDRIDRHDLPLTAARYGDG